MNLQDAFLNQVRLCKTPVSLYLSSGHQMKGMITGFDLFIVMLDSTGKQNMIYKHAIASIMPLKPVKLSLAAEEEQEKTHVPL